MAHIGVKNRTKEKQTLTFNGTHYPFAGGEVRILEGVPYEFVESRTHVRHATKEHKDDKGNVVRVEQLPYVVGDKLFEIIPLEEALKVAKPEEDPRVVKAREEAEVKARERNALIADIKAALVDEGWTPPSAEKSKDKPAPAKSGAGK
jgi:hypothetical protein